MNIEMKRNLRENGQSLVEVALFFPIFVLLLAGLVEVSQLLITQNRIASASREGTRFASNGGENVGITQTILRTVTQTLELEEQRWDIFSIRGEVNSAGDAIADWEFTHIYGISNTQEALQVNEVNIQTAVLSELQTNENNVTDLSLAAGLEFVGTYVIYDIESILGLTEFSPVADVFSISDISIMRSNADRIIQTNGCGAFPIALSKGVRSVTPPGTGSFPFPEASTFDYPSPPPTYAEHYYHTPNQSLSRASEGDLYLLDASSSQLRWLIWNEGIVNDSTTLMNSLQWPGNTLDYSAHGDSGTILPGFSSVVRGYAEPGDPTDSAMHEGDIVNASNSSLGDLDVTATIQNHIDRERHLRLVVWHTVASNHIVVERFGVFRIVGYSQSPEWLLVEFIRWDDSCGQQVAGP